MSGKRGPFGARRTRTSANHREPGHGHVVVPLVRVLRASSRRSRSNRFASFMVGLLPYGWKRPVVLGSRIGATAGAVRSQRWRPRSSEGCTSQRPSRRRLSGRLRGPMLSVMGGRAKAAGAASSARAGGLRPPSRGFSRQATEAPRRRARVAACLAPRSGKPDQQRSRLQNRPRSLAVRGMHHPAPAMSRRPKISAAASSGAPR